MLIWLARELEARAGLHTTRRLQGNDRKRKKTARGQPCNPMVQRRFGRSVRLAVAAAATSVWRRPRAPLEASPPAAAPARRRWAESCDSPGAANVDQGRVSKSVFVVGGIGAVGCVMLSLMMQHLLKVKGEHGRSPVATDIEQTFGPQLQGPVDLVSLLMDGERAVIVRLLAKADVDREQMGRRVAGLVWRSAHKLAETPDVLRVEVRRDAAEEPMIIDTRPPGLDGLRASSQKPKRPTAAATGTTAPPTPPK